MELWQIIKLLSDKFNQRLDKYRKESKNGKEFERLTSKQFLYLQAIHDLDKPTFRDLSRLFNVTPPSVTIAVQKLIELGYVEKEQSKDDRRSFSIYLNKEGKNLIRSSDASFKKLAKDVERWLTPVEIRQFEELTGKIKSGLDEE